MQKLSNYIIIAAGLVSTILFSCSEESTTEPVSAVYDASGTWSFIFTQTNIVEGDYFECGTEPVPQRSFEIMQDGNSVSLVDMNGILVNGNVSGDSYVFNFKELIDTNDVDYIDFHFEFRLANDTSFTGTYTMNRKTFFISFSDSFYCITSGTLAGSKPSVSKIKFNASNISSGNYFYKIQADNYAETKKMILLR